MRYGCGMWLVRSVLLAGLVALSGWFTPLARAQSLEAEQLFAREVLPVLKTKCFACHGQDSEDMKGDFSVLSREGLLLGGESGEPAIVPGNPEESPLLSAVRWEDLEMPPKENDRLSGRQISAIEKWISLGAPWPDDDRLQDLQEEQADDWSVTDGVRVATSGGLSVEWTERGYAAEDLWAYRPLKQPDLPKISGQVATPIDAFIQRQLEELGISPAGLADRHTLIRRATFDLTGLPPPPQEIDAFLQDAASDEVAFAKVVDRLLDSPHYGEHQARHWLDVVRYADSAGLANDFERPHAWRYRDYVVRSFNADKPYDQFVREQIAGDEVAPDDPEMLVATGFLRMGPWELTGMEVARVARQKFLDDVTDTVGQVFLSHPMQCARCHDHKFDPIPTRDYYRLQAAFATTQFAGREASFLREENTDGFDERKYLLERQARYKEILSGIQAKNRAAEEAWYRERGREWISRNEARQQGLPEEDIAPRHIGLSAEDLGMERIARKGLQRLAWELDRYKPFAFAVYSGLTPQWKSVYSPLRMPSDPLAKGELEKTAILTGGDPFSSGQEVSPGVLSCLPLRYDNGMSQQDSHALPDEIEGRRAALADWIASPENALALRSIVNRVWQWHFGQGLAGNTNNFGATGKKPTHPELLDWLASTFVEDGWSFKRLHRRILLSEAYRRASVHPQSQKWKEADPNGTSLAVFPARRLSAEEIRDAMLAISGELNRTSGGIPIRPEINTEVALQPRQVMGTFAAAWQPSPLPAQRHRRSLYIHQIRGLRVPFFEVFNQPSPETPCEVRDISTVTPQVFSLWNGVQANDRALAFAARLVKESTDERDAIRRAFRLAFGRHPEVTELAACVDHWRKMTRRHAGLQFPAPEYLREVVRQAIEENTGERFTYREPLESARDFQPDLKMSDAPARTRGLADVCLVLFNSNEFVYID